MSVHERKCLQSVYLPPVIDRSVPICRCAPGAHVSHRPRKLLHYLIAGGVVPSKILAIEQVHIAGFSGLHQQIRITAGGLRGNDHEPSGCLVHIVRIQLGLVGRREVVLDRRHAIGEVQIENAVSIVHAGRIRRGRRKISISGGHEHPAIRMIDRIDYFCCQPGPAHPYTGAYAVRRGAEGACLLQSLFVVPQDPSMPWAVVAVSREAYIHNAVEQQKTRPLVLPLGVKGERPARAAISGAGNRCGNHRRAPILLRS